MFLPSNTFVSIYTIMNTYVYVCAHIVSRYIDIGYLLLQKYCKANNHEP